MHSEDIYSVRGKNQDGTCLMGKRTKNNKSEPKERTETVLTSRLRSLIDAHRTTAKDVSEEAGYASGLVGDILRGRVKQPRLDTLDNIGGVLSTDGKYLLGQHDN